jgi:hypothetical protein
MMDNTTTPNNETPITKKPWVKPEIVLISAGNVNAKDRHYVLENTGRFFYSDAKGEIIISKNNAYATHRSDAAFS